MKRAIVAFTLALCACWDDAAPRTTQLTLVFTSDLQIPEQLDTLRVRVVGPDGSEQSASGQLRVQGDLPRRLVLRHTQGELAPLEVTAEGLLDGSTVVTRRARYAFVLNERRVAELALLARCVDACADAACTEDGCLDASVEPSTRAAEPADAAEPVDAEPADAAPSEPITDSSGVDSGPGAPQLDAGLDDAGPVASGGDGGRGPSDACVPTPACVTACNEASPRRKPEVCQCLSVCQ